MKFAAIDIGSNAVRLLICNVTHRKKNPLIKKELLVRSPIRLGEQAFIDGKIYDNKITMLTKAMSAYRNLMDIYGVKHYKACATSAMREAANGNEILQHIKEQTDISINIISGQKESTTIFEIYRKHLKEHEHKTFMSIDVGGGSTELVLFHNDKIIASQSFKIGTLRVLNEQVKPETWDSMKGWLENLAAQYPNIHGLGSGGNIIKIHKIYVKDNHKKPITPELLKHVDEHLNSFTLRERIHTLGLKPDRADVIVPATTIFRNVLQWAKMKKLFVLKMGLSDGIIKELYQKHYTEMSQTSFEKFTKK